MPTKVQIVAPPHLSTPAGIKFDTYRFYLECISDNLVAEYIDLPGLASACHSASASLKALPRLDPSAVESYFRIAWNTEFLLGIDNPDPEIVRISNQWSPIFYVIPCGTYYWLF